MSNKPGNYEAQKLASEARPDPTADAAKRLQIRIAHAIADCDCTGCLSRAKTIMNMIENTRPQPAPPEGEPDFGGITLVRQKNPSGCVIASLAMVTGNSYDDILATYQWAHDGCDMETVASDYLYRCGIAWQRIYINQPAPRFENHHRAEWPPKPWAPAHLCMVETSQAHCVVMKSDGTVLDPLTDEPRTLADYRKVMQVWGLYRLGLAARPKVDDAEVATEIALIDGFLGGTHGTDKESFRLYMKRWRDLLEHLSADRDERKQQHENLVGVRQADIANLAAKIDRLKAELERRKGDPRTRLHNLCEALQEDLDKSPYTREEWEQVDRQTVDLQRKLREAETKLAEREAELAKADAVINWFDDYCGPSFRELAGEILIVKFETAIKRHAARQQQKENC